MSLSLYVSAVCDIGCIRPNNEDMILLQTELFRDGEREAVFNAKERVVIAVADGVGGLAKGHVASERVLTALRDLLINLPNNLENYQLRDIFDTFVSETHQAMPKNMGSTLAGLFFYSGRLFRFHAGDSRVYRLRRGILERLTIDHSLRESGGDPSAPLHIITNAIGGGSSAYIDFEEIENPISNNDIYMLSSDGMHDYVSMEKIISSVKKTNAAAYLTSIAKQEGSVDNISVITISILDK